ncbi:FkbM family methyltransferase [Fluviicola taffensis]|uniref:Methyltransferase FkbM family n=1 Tax=Fluviicola taffensis (strain DSM 16823 / NCIMB 13979 / RW262) TaxID=755732 RepID=F2IJ11_FLUTR|nr:FkbM family methyltransferase [Fluviicola taffensis]AEA43869.1 methyltransferase FkbM family [Fluviicola taffensis DSM 16823]
MKNSVKYILQKLLGLHTYLYVFALYKIRTLRSDKKENDFFTFLSLLKDGKGDVLDIGANLGVMTVHLANTLPNTTIHAFEPMPANVSVLKKIIAKFKLSKAKIHEIALGDESGTAKMVLPVNGSTIMQGLSHVKHETITEWNEGQEVDVKLDKLDNILNGQPVQAIKIDIENFEYFALKGANRIITSNKPIIYAELWDNENRSKCFDYLKSFNYSVYVGENKSIVLFDSSKHHTQNFIFIAE